MEPELGPLAQWELELLAQAASWDAERRTQLSELGSGTFITTPPRRAFSPTAVGEPLERLAMQELPQPEKVMVAGDWHGNLPWAFKAINYALANGADVILHVGDFGWWSPGERTWQYLREVNRELDAAGITLYWVDGNHEFHDYLDVYNRPGNWAWCSDNYPRIFHLPRGFRWEWWGDVYMSLGGAYSVDRTFGQKGETWWEGETLTSEQVEHACRPGRVDIIVSHDAPSGVKVPGIEPFKDVWLNIGGKPRRVPASCLLAAHQHRDLLQVVCDKVKPLELYHGHYHRAYTALARVEGGDYMHVRGLDKDETTMAKNTHFITEGIRSDSDDDDDLAW